MAKLNLNGKKVSLYGNLFLLTCPEKFAVRVRRHFSDMEVKNHYNEALIRSEEGSVIVSPFISKAEKEIREKVETKGGKIILIQHEKFADKFKPAKREFDLCSKGRLLIVSLGMDSHTGLTYQIATEMNELAAYISRATFDTRLLFS